MTKALFKIAFGLALVASGIALEALWLGFCFGTVIVGIVLLLWFTPILFFPFSILSIPGWGIVKDGLQELNPPNIGKISTAIAPILDAQMDQIELAGGRAPLDARVLAYIAALSFVASRRNLSLQNVIDITARIYTDPQYKLSVENLQYCVGYSDHLRGFWEAVKSMASLAQGEMAAGQGSVLVQLFQEDRKGANANAIG